MTTTTSLMVVGLCSFCSHEQKIKSKLKFITCSSCRKKYANPNYINRETKTPEIKEDRAEMHKPMRKLSKEELKTIEKGDIKKVSLE